MDDQSALAPEAGPEVVADEALDIEGQAEGQTAPPEPEGEDGEKKTAASQRREREKAQKERLRTERDQALAEAKAAQERRDRILTAGKAEKPPTESEYQDPLEYVAAKAVWAAGQQMNQREAREIGEAEEAAKARAAVLDKAEQDLINQAWVGHVSEAKARYADFDAVALAPDVPVTPAMARLIQTSDVGADVLYHLGQNRALAAEIAALQPYEAARAIGRLEATITTPRPRTSTNAPAPISPVKGGAPVGKDPAKMSLAEFSAWRASGGTPTL